MLTPERHRIILNCLENQQVVKLQELVQATSSSESTIRRDLDQLEKEYKLRRVHGGATLASQHKEEPSLSEKSVVAREEKKAIAQFASTLIRDGDSIFLDAGTTTYEMIPYLRDRDIQVVTNGLSLLEALTSEGIPTYLTGGYVKHKTRALVGHSAVKGIQNFRYDKCFLGVNAVHSQHGYTTPDPEEAAVKQEAIGLSEVAFVLADESKMERVTFTAIAPLHAATLITNVTHAELLSELEKNTTVKVVTT
ncbi:DeoR family transcriptional regulator [Pontibacillus halophilus JSM 076056 = DSM 19796]|uniref:DeoR family transcriptional regulator n=1 Tax=Pontibacillus halophilus JSM 076056 = DSM 19796 TaxID=1385510 RepID=A0A0A5GI00_9BACI|nr:DeoR/GlpR family DNA-binding transcription regulator [Pontibacillus halophilus]KGX92876.1 DeoR family transcriptional regulator [Pontibacillus halophilus JSM 076056 = DSM 19796]